MSKELEALKRIKKSHHTAIAVMGCERDYETENAIDIIEKELQRLESIDNANPSEAIKCLTGLEKEITQRDGRITDFLKIKFDTIKQALLKAQEQEKILKIIKEKNVDIWLLKSCLTVKQYNFSITKIDDCKVFNLTQEEFDLLKRWLG